MGTTEDARLEKAKMQGWKMQHQTAGVENAGSKLQGWKTWEKACMDSLMLLYMLLFMQLQPI